MIPKSFSNYFKPINKDMEITDSSTSVPAGSKPVSIIRIIFTLVAFLAPILILPVISIIALPELSHAYKTPASSLNEVVATIVMSLCFAGFATAFVSIAQSFKNRHEASSPLPLRTLTIQTICLILAGISALFL